jgi:hypothetical protein
VALPHPPKIEPEMGSFNDLARKWNVRKANDALNEKSPSHIVGCTDFFNELIVLQSLTFDNRFLAARKIISDACAEYGLTDGRGNWKKDFRPLDDLPPPDYHSQVANLLARGKSIREACATVVVSNHVNAASFEAAVAQVKLIWQKEKARKVEQLGGGKNP